MDLFSNSVEQINYIKMDCSKERITSDDKYLIRWDISVHFFENGEISSTTYRQRYKVVRETNACFVIDDNGKHRFVHKVQDGRRFAYLTDNLAINSLRRRVKWRNIHANNALQQANAADAEFVRLFKSDVNEIKDELVIKERN